MDDVDLLGVYVAPIEHYLGFGGEDVYERWEGRYDCVFYELRKFVGLLLKSNPNILSMLWIEDEHILYEDESWRLLKDNRGGLRLQAGLPLLRGLRAIAVQ